MKFAAVLFLCLAASSVVLAQGAAAGESQAAQSLAKGAWEFEPFAGGGTGVGRASNTHFFIAGGRVGRILTNDHLSGWARGNFELAADLMPVYVVAQPGGAVYGASFKPIIFKWNFVGHRKIAPYALIAAGVLFTTSNVPPGDTSSVNFTPQAALGFHFFTRPKRAWTLEIAAVHHSNASLGRFNPGLNASIFVTVGYSWFK